MRSSAQRKPLPTETEFVRAAWKRFRASNDRSAFLLILKHYQRLAKFHARRVMPREGAKLELCDLVSVGHIALIESIRSYDPDGAGTFVAYSWRIIRRAMLDELDLYTWRRKSDVRLNKIVEPIRERFVQDHGHTPAPEELHLLVQADPRYTGRNFGKRIDGIEIELSGAAVEHAASAKTLTPLAIAIAAETRAQYFARMTRRQRAIFHRFFFAGQGVKQIAKDLHRHRSTMSRDFSRLIMQLRSDRVLMDRLGVDRFHPELATFNSKGNRGDLSTQCVA